MMLRIEKNWIIGLAALHLLLRTIVAISTGLGIDEVYYVAYGLYPDWSYFDHPPMLAVLERFFTLDMRLMGAFFIRLGPLVVGTVNLFLLYTIGKRLKDEKAGLIAAILGMSSFYISFATGTFLLPDTPQSLFWLWAILLFIRYIDSGLPKWIYLFGLMVGLGMLSKYHAVFLWGGAGLYFLKYDWKKLYSKEVLMAAFISLLLFFPVILWNYFNSFSSLNFHSGRIGNKGMHLRFDLFLQEVLGELLYNNPILVVFILSALVFYWKNRKTVITKKIWFLFAGAIPLLVVVFSLSFFNKTLPHWTGPAYFNLILVGAVYASQFLRKSNPVKIDRYLLGSLLLFLMGVLLGLAQVHAGIFPLYRNAKEHKIGSKDPSVDLYVWDKVAPKIKAVVEEDINSGLMDEGAVLLTHKWFPAANIDYYYARPNGKKLYVIGNAERKHLYGKINQLHGDIPLGSDAYYITTSKVYTYPLKDLFSSYGSHSSPIIIPVYRRGDKIFNLYMWRLKDLLCPLDMDMMKETK